MFGSLAHASLAHASLAHAPLQREPVGGAYADGVVLRRVGAEGGADACEAEVVAGVDDDVHIFVGQTDGYGEVEGLGVVVGLVGGGLSILGLALLRNLETVLRKLLLAAHVEAHLKAYLNGEILCGIHVEHYGHVNILEVCLAVAHAGVGAWRLNVFGVVVLIFAALLAVVGAERHRHLGQHLVVDIDACHHARLPLLFHRYHRVAGGGVYLVLCYGCYGHAHARYDGKGTLLWLCHDSCGDGEEQCDDDVSFHFSVFSCCEIFII